MAKIQINNPRQTINGGAKKYYFKVKGFGGPKGDKGDKGDTGSRGPQGEPGNAATVYVGSTTTLPVGQDATVENVGTQYNAVLDFGIPQGPQGPQGAKGDKGDTGAQGETGPRGPQGEKGTNATVYVGTTTTTNPGTQARVYNSGTDSNAVLNFEIPRGDVGPQPELVQTTGTSTTKAMSQNATTVALSTKQNTIDSSHKLSADLVDDTDATNKFVTAEDKTNWNAKQNALTAGTGIDIENGVISTPAIVPEVVAELPTTGEEGKLYLTPKNYTRSTATGNPITATVSEEAGALESFQLDGDTFQQSYTGKNLLAVRTDAFTDTRGGVTWSYDPETQIFTFNGTTTTDNITFGLPAQSHTIEAGSTLYLTIEYVSGSIDGVLRLQSFESGYGNSAYVGITGESSVSATKQITAESVRVIHNMHNTAVGQTFNDFKIKCYMSTVDATYEPYVGGQPSPNPEYPQPIQTVTGLQTITINGTDYPLDLGTIELCKLGDYQDYIWKDGEDWKVHKATSGNMTLNGSEDGWSKGNNGRFNLSDYAPSPASGSADNNPILSNRFISRFSFDDLSVFLSGTNELVCFIYTSASTLTAWKAWLSSNNTTVCYALATPTDTEITDTTLIAQLEAIRTASLQNGANTITNTATGSNLAGDMEIGYYGFAPRNRYDKWLWLDINNEYEQIGS